jgi:T-complex protein 1 subunit theta
LETIASSITGLDQYSFKQYAKSFEIIPRILSQNSGLNEDEIVAKLYSSHNSGTPAGIDVENQSIKNSEELKVYDHLETKLWAIRLASDAAITVLRVDQIIISKPAGGPKPQKNSNWDEDQ